MLPCLVSIKCVFSSLLQLEPARFSWEPSHHNAFVRHNLLRKMATCKIPLAFWVIAGVLLSWTGVICWVLNSFFWELSCWSACLSSPFVDIFVKEHWQGTWAGLYSESASDVWSDPAGHTSNQYCRNFTYHTWDPICDWPWSGEGTSL